MLSDLHCLCNNLLPRVYTWASVDAMAISGAVLEGVGRTSNSGRTSCRVCVSMARVLFSRSMAAGSGVLSMYTNTILVHKMLMPAALGPNLI